MPDVDIIIRTIDERDSAAAVEALARDPDSTSAAKAFLDVMTELYWKRKNLPACIAIGQAGIAFALARAFDADSSGNKELSYKLRSTAKGLCYNLASFTWDGWAEPGVAITPSDLAAGLDAAKANLRLAEELNKGDLPLSRAHWMLAGHYLSIADHAKAASLYRRAAEHAAAAGSRQEELLNQAFASLVARLIAPDDAHALAHMESACNDLREQPDGAGFVRQIETAHQFFAKKLQTR